IDQDQRGRRHSRTKPSAEVTSTSSNILNLEIPSSRMSGIIVIEARETIADPIVARLRKSPAAESCRRLRLREIDSLGYRVQNLAEALDDQSIDTVVYSPTSVAPLRMTPDLLEAEAFLRQ